LQEGKTPLDMAEEEEVKALLREHGGKYSLFGVVEKGMLEDIAELIKEGVDVNQQNAVSRACNRVRILCLCVCAARARARACACVEREREKKKKKKLQGQR
jgi:hypothetical protein